MVEYKLLRVRDCILQNFNYSETGTENIPGRYNKNKKCKDLGYVFAPFDRQEEQHGINGRLENRRRVFWYWVCHLLLAGT